LIKMLFFENDIIDDNNAMLQQAGVAIDTNAEGSQFP